MRDLSDGSSEDELSQKRQLVYASLLRYAPETAPLRERIFDRLVIAALLGSHEQNAYRIGAVQANLVFGANVPRNLRVERIQESLQRLREKGKVEVTQIRQRHAYYLTGKGQDELKRVIGSAGDVLQPVLKKLLLNTDHSLSFEVGSKVVQGFIFECFARFGAQMAKTVTGQLEASDLLRNADAAAAFDAAISGAALTPDVRESLQARCIQFLKSADTDDLNLKFCLAQGYYFAQLVGLQNGGFSPLAEQAFDGSSFYLDTNVLLYGLLPDKDDRAVFAELVTLAERLRIHLVVTHATIRETLSLPDNFSKELSRVMKVLPGELVDRVKDQLTESFLRARDENPGMTLDVFLSDIRNVEQVVKSRWGINILDEFEDQILVDEVPAGIATVIQEEAVKSRGWEKPEAALRHDVAHFFLVQRKRLVNPKSWFLTRDRGLGVAGTLLAGQGEQPFTFDFHGFLQTVSPFLVSTGEQLGVASIISSLLVDQLFPRERVFNLKELFLLAEMHEDVLSTPKEQLIQAVDYVKSTVLAGKTYKPSDYNHVSLGLKSFLACSSEQQRQELERQKAVREQEAQEQKQIAAEERRLRQESQRKIQDQLLEIADLKEAGTETNQQLISLKAESSEQLYLLSKRAANAELRIRFVLMLIGYAAAIAIWDYEGKIVGYSLWKWNVPLAGAVLFTRLLGLVAFMLPSTIWLRRVGWRENRKIAFLALSLLIGLRLAKLAEPSVSIYSMSALATSIGTLLLLLADRQLLIGRQADSTRLGDRDPAEPLRSHD